MYFAFLPETVSESCTSPLVVVMPVYNEALNIREVVGEWLTCLEKAGLDAQMLLLNDGSKDQTAGVLGELENEFPGRLIVVNKRNEGHGRSCRFGYEACAASPNVEWVLQIDSDGQCDPSYFQAFWNASEQADCVFGERTGRDDGWARVQTSRLCAAFSSLITGSRLVDPNVPYRLMRTKVLRDALEQIPPSFNIHNVALTLALHRNPACRWVRIPIHFRDRQGGSNSIDLMNVFTMGMGLLIQLRKLRKHMK